MAAEAKATSEGYLDTREVVRKGNVPVPSDKELS